MPHAKFHAHLGLAESNSGPFTPVSPSNLEQLTIRSQQVRVEDTDYFQEALHHHQPHPGVSGYDTPAPPALAAVETTTIPVDFWPTLLADERKGPEAYAPPVNFDEQEDRRAEIRADAERPFPVNRSMLKDIIESVLRVEVAYLQFLSSGKLQRFLFSLPRLRLVACDRDWVMAECTS